MSGVDWDRSWDEDAAEEKVRTKLVRGRERVSKYEYELPRWRGVRKMFDAAVDRKDELGRFFVLLDAPGADESRHELAKQLRDFLETEDLRVALVTLPTREEVVRHGLEAKFFPLPGEEVSFGGAIFVVGLKMDARRDYGVFGVSLSPR